jgi:4-hydroxy-tetrahydrodipicolinate synthase
MTKLRGVLVALATPFTATDSVDEEALRRLVDRLIQDGVHAMIPCGSTGEFAALTHQERRRVTEVVIEQADGRLPVVPQTGAMTTSEAIELSQHAERAGAAGVMVVAPYYEALNLDEAKDYYRQVAGSVSIDVMLYNLPAATGINLAPEDIRQLAEKEPNIRYVKDSSGDFDQATVLLHSHADVVSTFVGMDTSYLSSIVEGASGAVLGSANFLGPALTQIYDSVKGQDFSSALSAWESIFGMMKALGAGSDFVSGVKGAMRIVGHPVGDPRAPIRPLTESRASQFELLLRGIGDHMLTGHRSSVALDGPGYTPGARPG